MPRGFRFPAEDPDLVGPLTDIRTASSRDSYNYQAVATTARCVRM